MPERIGSGKCPVEFKDLGLIDYQTALDIQTECLEKRIQHPDTRETVFLLEHPPVFTLGKNGGAENLVVSKDFLADKSIDIIQTRRGGNITGHCPGQVVMYPVIDLEKNKIGVTDFVVGLEEMMIKTAAALGVTACRSSKNHGVWVNNNKIGSVGLGIKKGVCFHGISFNLNPDMEFFSWINPCGLHGVSMTCIQNELHLDQKMDKTPSLSIEKTKDLLKRYFFETFNFRPIRQ